MEEWKEYKLGDIITIKYGKDHKQIADGNIPIYGSGGIMRFGNRSLYEGPSILIPRKGSLNNIMYSDKPFWTVDTMFWTIINTTIANPLFVYYAICKKDFASLNVGSAVPSLTVPVIEGIDISLPSLFEQDKIVSILKSLDDKIEINRRINENLEQQAQALFKSWFVDFEPFRDQPFVESELGMIPQGWRVGKLSDIADIYMGASPTGSSYNVLGIGDVFYQGRAEFGVRFPQRNMYTTEAKRFAEVNSVLLSVRAPVGDINVAEERCCIGRGLASIKSKTNHNSFNLYLMKQLKPIFDTYNGEGTVFGCINKKALESLKIIIPDGNVIDKFDSIVSYIDEKIRVLEKQSRTLSSLRDTLLPRLMSGELKVQEIEESL